MTTTMHDEAEGVSDNDVAVIGLACRVPGAEDVHQFWQNLRAGVHGITFWTPAELVAMGAPAAVVNQARYVGAEGVLADVKGFDAPFFGVSPQEAALLDPQQRLFLGSVWTALEDAGCVPAWEAGLPKREAGLPKREAGLIGLFGGVGVNRYLLHNLRGIYEQGDQFDRYRLMLAGEKDYLCTRVAYKLGLRGPSVTVQTACSTSLVATHMAVQSLLNGECDVAVAGGVSLQLGDYPGYLYHEGMIASPDGYCRAFDARAQGTVWGSGVGAVVLKRATEAVADGDRIYALVKGSAINNDGTDKVTFTAPSVTGQAAVIAEALALAGIDGAQVGYVEAHGTGTVLGDPIEVAALTQAFTATTATTAATGFCGLGSVKTNIGHLDAAAGVMGLIKAVLSLYHETMPASLHFEQPNPAIDFENSPFFVVDRERPWPRQAAAVRYAGVSAFGIGGTNAHVVLGEAPPVMVADEVDGEAYLLPLSAKSEAAVAQLGANLAAYLAANEAVSLAAVAQTLQVGRAEWAVRATAVARTRAEAIAQLRSGIVATVTEYEGRPVAFLFPGQGAYYAGMGRALYASEPFFREQVDLCQQLLAPHWGYDVRALMRMTSAEEAQLADTAVAQPFIFTMEYALAQMWIELLGEPAAMMGHSLGEYVAACVAGVFTLAEALALVTKRGALMAALPRGGMLAVLASAAAVVGTLPAELSLAGVNGPTQVVVSGPLAALAAYEVQLVAAGVKHKRLAVSHAFHSAMMDPMLAEFEAFVGRLSLAAPTIPYIANVTGVWQTAEAAVDPVYWRQHVRQAVLFAAGAELLLAEPDMILLEVGAGQTLSKLVRRHPDWQAGQAVIASWPGPAAEERPLWLAGVGQVWQAGGAVTWSQLATTGRGVRAWLPPYPFARDVYWVEAPAVGAGGAMAPAQFVLPERMEPEAGAEGAAAAPLTGVAATVAAVWRGLLGYERVTMESDFYALGGDSLLALQMVAQLNEQLGVTLSPNLLLAATTLGEVAAAVVAAVGEGEQTVAALASRASSILVPLRAGQAMAPLFLIHPVGGRVHYYRDLVAALDTPRPIYGVQAYGLDDTAVPLDTVAAMATAYLAVIRGQQPRGPYWLGGASFGGTVAYEIARQLEAAGETVALLVLMDTPGETQMPAKLEGERTILLYMADVLFPGHSLTLAALQAYEGEALLAYVWTALGGATGLAPDVAAVRQLVTVFAANTRAMWAYEAGAYAGEILFFQAAERRPQYDPPQPAVAWLGLAAGGLRLYQVAGNHITMMSRPWVAEMASRLSGYLT